MAYTVAGQVSKLQMLAAKGGRTALAEESASYDNEGKMQTWKMWDSQTAGGSPVTGPTYGYSFDAQGRVNGATFGGATLVSGVVYNAAGQVTSMTYEGWTETRQFNTLGQMTRLTVGGRCGGLGVHVPGDGQ
jgi:hypothetical protein